MSNYTYPGSYHSTGYSAGQYSGTLDCGSTPEEEYFPFAPQETYRHPVYHHQGQEQLHYGLAHHENGVSNIELNTANPMVLDMSFRPQEAAWGPAADSADMYQADLLGPSNGVEMCHESTPISFVDTMATFKKCMSDAVDGEEGHPLRSAVHDDVNMLHEYMSIKQIPESNGWTNDECKQSTAKRRPFTPDIPSQYLHLMALGSSSKQSHPTRSRMEPLYDSDGKEIVDPVKRSRKRTELRLRQAALQRAAEAKERERHAAARVERARRRASRISGSGVGSSGSAITSSKSEPQNYAANSPGKDIAHSECETAAKATQQQPSTAASNTTAPGMAPKDVCKEQLQDKTENLDTGCPSTNNGRVENSVDRSSSPNDGEGYSRQPSQNNSTAHSMGNYIMSADQNSPLSDGSHSGYGMSVYSGNRSKSPFDSEEDMSVSSNTSPLLDEPPASLKKTSRPRKKQTRGTFVWDPVVPRISQNDEAWEAAHRDLRGLARCRIKNCRVYCRSIAELCEHYDMHSSDQFTFHPQYFCTYEGCPWHYIGFENSSELGRHHKSQHCEKMFVCDGCQKRFGRCDSLRRHEKCCASYQQYMITRTDQPPPRRGPGRPRKDSSVSPLPELIPSSSVDLFPFSVNPQDLSLA